MKPAKQNKAPSAEILSFMDELDSFLKKDKTPLAKKNAKVAPPLTIKPHRYERLSLNKSFTPTARLTIITHQSCQCCGDSVEFVSQPLKTFSNKKLASISIPDPDESLPLTLRTEFTSVPKCAKCLRFEATAEFWLDTRPAQRSLFEGDSL